MSRLLAVLALPLIALSCGKEPTPPKPEPPSVPRRIPATTADADATYICHMGADCGKEEVKKGAAIPGCCGQPMLKAATYACEKCKKEKITSAAAETPKCCSETPMKKVSP